MGAENVMSLKKQYLKKPRVCKVTFSCPKEAVRSAANVSLVGDFNEWNEEAIPMKRLKNGTFTATVTLEPNKEYHFRSSSMASVGKTTGTRTSMCPITTAATTQSSRRKSPTRRQCMNRRWQFGRIAPIKFHPEKSGFLFAASLRVG